MSICAMDRWIYVFCMLSALFFKAYNCIQINDISVPSMVFISGNNEVKVVMDCDYDLSPDDKTLVLKWYKNDQVVYQWIMGQSPSVYPSFIDEVDDDYKASPELDKMYSSLSLLNPSIQSTGSYKCVVLTKGGIDTMEKHLQVIDISNHSLILYNHRVDNETQLECTVDNVYPKPTLTLNTIDDDEEVSVVSERVLEDENGFYNATSIAVIGDDDEDDDEYICIVTFENTSFNLTTRAVLGGVNALKYWQHILLIPTIVVVASHIFV